MPQYRIVYDKSRCSAAFHCVKVQPEFWEKGSDGKAVLKRGVLNPGTGKYELPIKEKDFAVCKQSALVCPVYVIDIVDDATGKSVLNINPTLNADSKDIPVLRARYDSSKEWTMDPKGFFTIKTFPEEKLIRMRCYGADHALKLLIEGGTAEEIYNTVVRENLVSTFQHAAYVGCELMKAETALKLKLDYVQDDPLHLP